MTRTESDKPPIEEWIDLGDYWIRDPFYQQKLSDWRKELMDKYWLENLCRVPLNSPDPLKESDQDED